MTASGDGASGKDSWGTRRFFYQILLLIGAVRALFLVGVSWAPFPIDLAGDEAYYWQWGQHLALGYYSKPPGIGWLMALIDALAGRSALAIHATALLFGTISTAFLYELGRAMGGGKVGLLAALLFAMSPAAVLLHWLLTIDAPLTLCWTAALFFFWKSTETGFRNPRWSLALGLALFAGNLSKQMMLVFYPLAVLFLVFEPRRRHLLKNWRVWTCFGASVLALIPPLVWNARNGWVTFEHTAGHFTADQPGSSAAIARFGEFLATFLGVMSPITAVLTIITLIAVPKNWRRVPESARCLWWFSAPALLAITVLSFRQEINPNWPAVFYLAPAILVALWGVHGLCPTSAPKMRMVWIHRAWKLSLSMALSLYGVIAIGSLENLKLPDSEPTGRIRGWSRVASKVQTIRESDPRWADVPIITQSHRFLNSELAFYLENPPPIFMHRDDYGRVYSQHDLWPGPESMLGSDFLIITDWGKEIAPELAARFRKVELIQELTFPRIRKKQRSYQLYFGQSLLEWPDNPFLNSSPDR